MTGGILLAVLAAVLYGFLGITFEVAGKRRYDVWEVMFWKQLAGFLIGFVVWRLTGATEFYQPPLVALALCGACSYIITLSAYLTASRERDIAANWTILNLSVVIPILVSIFWFGDALTAARGMGVALTVVSIAVIGGGLRGAAAAGSGWWRLIGIAFLFNSVLVILFRFVPPGQETLFTAYFYGLSVPMLAIVHLIHKGRWRPPADLLAISAGGAATHWSGIVLTMLALVSVAKHSGQAGVIVYPITNGLVIPIGVILGAVLLKQPVRGRAAAGVVLGMAGLVFLFLP